MDYSRLVTHELPLYPQKSGKALRPPYVDHLVHGYGSRCECKPTTVTDYSNNTRDRAYPRGMSCRCQVGKLIGRFKRLGWDSGEVFSLAMGQDTFNGFAWLRNEFSPEDTFTYLWENSYTMDEVKAHKATVAHDKPKERKPTTYRHAVWLVVLDYIEHRPGVSTRTACQEIPYARGLVQDYITEGKRRGYIEDRGKTGPTGKILQSSLHVVCYPTEPRITRPRWNQPKAQQDYWRRVRAIPALDAMADWQLVEHYESGMLDRLVAAWEREHVPEVTEHVPEVTEHEQAPQVPAVPTRPLPPMDHPGHWDAFWESIGATA